MKSVSSAAGPHNGPIRLWAEDTLTQLFLLELWQDPVIDIEVSAGGHQGVHYMVRTDHEKRRIRYVFGLVDRDFLPDDSTRWANPDYRVFRTTSHELENHLLDFDALGALAGCTAEDVENKGRSHAQNLLWWMACKATLNDLWIKLHADFPEDRKAPQSNETFGEVAAVEHIMRSTYFANHAAAFAEVSAPPFIERRVAHHGSGYTAALADGSWPELFSGKEIFRYLRSHVPGLDRPAGASGTLTEAQRDEDLGRRVARYYHSHQPPELFTRLHAELRKRAGLRADGLQERGEP